MNREEQERQNTIDIRSYSGTIKEELDRITKELRKDRGRIYELSEPAIRKLMSMRLKRMSKELDILSRRVMHVA